MNKLRTGADFDGDTYEPDKDKVRLTGQLMRVYNAMHDGSWHTLRWLADEASASEASVSARLRDLRKDKFGGFCVERKRSEIARGLWFYRLVIPKEPVQFELVP